MKIHSQDHALLCTKKKVYHSISFPFDKKLKKENTSNNSFFFKNLKTRTNPVLLKKIVLVR